MSFVAAGVYVGAERLFGSPFPVRRHFEFTYRALLPEIPREAKQLRLWFPLAPTRDGQRILKREVSSPVPYEIHQESVFGNEMFYVEIDREKEEISTPLAFEIRYEADIERLGALGVADASELQKFLQPSRLMTQPDAVKKMAAEATEGKKTWWEQARGIYDYVIHHMAYDKTAPGWGKGDTLRACLLGKGNCTDFHSLFISMAQVAQIPSRFKIGFPIPREGEGKVSGYHCWAEFFDAQRGWTQVDASEAWKNPKMKKHYFGGFDTNKFFVSLGRDIDLEPKQEGEPVNIFIYPYVEIDGKPAGEGSVQTEFYFKNLQS